MDIEKVHDEILSGGVVKVLFMLGWPMMVTSFLQSTYNLADTYWVGQLGPTEGAQGIAAVSMVWPVVWFMLSFGQGLGMAGIALISQYTGAKKHKRANDIAGQVFFFYTAFSVVLGAMGFFLAPYIIGVMGPGGDVNQMAIQYIRVIFVGLPFMFTMLAFSFLLRGYGDTKTPMYVQGASVVLNIILDPIMIYGIPGIEYSGFGFIGVAYATFISRFFASIVGFYLLFGGKVGIKLGLEKLKPVYEDIKQIVKVGLPSSIGMSGSALGFIVIMSLVARVGSGTVPLAALGVGNRVTSMIFVIINGLAIALSTMVGQNLGNGNVARADKTAKAAIALMAAILTVASVIIWIIREPLIAAFTENAAVIKEGGRFLGIFAFFMPFFGVFRAVTSVYNGSGHTKYSMGLSLLRLWGLRVPLLATLVFIVGLGSTGIWLAMGLSNFIGGLTALGFFYWGKWKVPVARGIKEKAAEVT